MKTALILGAGGQDGRIMSALLASRDINVVGLTKEQFKVGVEPIRDLLVRFKPDYIFHFAAHSSTCHTSLMDNQRAIVDGTINILESVMVHAPKCKVFLSGSILQFYAADNPIGIESQPAYDSAYAAQRHASVAMARFYRSLGVDVRIGYFAHHDSPYRTERHLAMRIAQTVKRIVRGSPEILHVRDPEDIKEWNYAGDMMEAVWCLMNSPLNEAMIGSGVGHSIGDYISECYAAARAAYGSGCELGHPVCAEDTRTPTCTITDPEDLRMLGWSPAVKMPELARMLVTC